MRLLIVLATIVGLALLSVACDGEEQVQVPPTQTPRPAIVVLDPEAWNWLGFDDGYTGLFNGPVDLVVTVDGAEGEVARYLSDDAKPAFGGGGDHYYLVTPPADFQGLITVSIEFPQPLDVRGKGILSFHATMGEDFPGPVVIESVNYISANGKTDQFVPTGILGSEGALLSSRYTWYQWGLGDNPEVYSQLLRIEWEVSMPGGDGQVFMLDNISFK